MKICAALGANERTMRPRVRAIRLFLLRSNGAAVIDELEVTEVTATRRAAGNKRRNDYFVVREKSEAMTGEK